MQTKNQISLTRKTLSVIILLGVFLSAFSVGNVLSVGAQAETPQTPTPTNEPPACHTLDLVIAAGKGTLTATTAQNCNGGYLVNTIVDLVAEPAEGYYLLSWLGSDNDALNENTNKVTISANISIHVTFRSIEENTLPLTVSSPVLLIGQSSEPPAEGSDEITGQSVIGTDQRTRITATTSTPWRWIADVDLTFPDGASFTCTGFFVGPRHLLTAGHCVWDSDHGGWAESAEVIPGKDGASKPYGSGWASSLSSNTNWTNNEDTYYDYGLISMPDATLGNQVGWFNYGYFSNSYLNNAGIANIAGYPGDKLDPFGCPLNGGCQLWYDGQTITNIGSQKLSYETDTVGGQSGSPVWIINNSIRYAVGIHTNGVPDSSCYSGDNCGRKIDKALADWVQSFTSQSPYTDCYSLTLSKTGQGGDISTFPSQSAGCPTRYYIQGEVISLTASPATGWTVGSWAGTNNNSSASTGNSLTMPEGSHSASVNYIQNNYTLTVSTVGTGSGTVMGSGISCPGDCTESYVSGTSVTVTANASTGSTFTGWSGACSGTGSCSVSMTVARSVTATFTANPNNYTLTVSTAGTGSGTVTGSGIICPGDCSESYISGTSVTLTANQATGSTFAGWSGACTGTSSCIVSMTVARSVTATFNSNGATDDNYEQNDTLATAYDLSSREQIWLSTINGHGIQADDDWYHIIVTPGYQRVLVDAHFTHSQGDIDIALHDSSGNRLAVSEGIVDNEYIDYTVPSGGTYYIKVYWQNQGNQYDLWWDAMRPSLPSANTSIDLTIAGASQGTYPMVPETSQVLKYTLDGGPVEISSDNGAGIIASLNQWRRPTPTGGWTGVAQSMALPVEQISNRYYIPRYNGTDPTLYNAVLMANVDTVPRTITVRIGGTVMGSYLLGPSDSRFEVYNVTGGPLVVSSVLGSRIVASLYELKRAGVSGEYNGQSEMMGLPWTQGSDKYLIPIYFGMWGNYLDASLAFANVDSIATTVEVKIAGVSRGTYLMQPSTSKVVKYALDGGPVEISSNNGARIVASLNQWRRPTPTGGWTGVAQSLALPMEKITNSYVIPRYNGTDPSLYNAVLMANVDTVPRTITVKIGGTVMGSYDLGPSDSRFEVYNVTGGPIVVSSEVGSKIVASLYELKRATDLGEYNGQSEMMGLPATALSDKYLIPIYFGMWGNYLDASLYIGVP